MRQSPPQPGARAPADPRRLPPLTRSGVWNEAAHSPDTARLGHRRVAEAAAVHAQLEAALARDGSSMAAASADGQFLRDAAVAEVDDVPGSRLVDTDSDTESGVLSLCATYAGAGDLRRSLSLSLGSVREGRGPLPTPRSGAGSSASSPSSARSRSHSGANDATDDPAPPPPAAGLDDAVLEDHNKEWRVSRRVTCGVLLVFVLGLVVEAALAASAYIRVADLNDNGRAFLFIPSESSPDPVLLTRSDGGPCSTEALVQLCEGGPTERYRLRRSTVELTPQNDPPGAATQPGYQPSYRSNCSELQSFTTALPDGVVSAFACDMEPLSAHIKELMPVAYAMRAGAATAFVLCAGRGLLALLFVLVDLSEVRRIPLAGRACVAGSPPLLLLLLLLLLFECRPPTHPCLRWEAPAHEGTPTATCCKTQTTRWRQLWSGRTRHPHVAGVAAGAASDGADMCGPDRGDVLRGG